MNGENDVVVGAKVEGEDSEVGPPFICIFGSKFEPKGSVMGI